MGNLVADAMRAKYPEADAAITNSGGLRPDILGLAAERRRAAGQITYGEVFAVLPFGNPTVIETLTGAQFTAALQNGFKPPCGDVAGGTGRTPQISGLQVDVPLQRHRAGDRLDRQGRARRHATPVGPADTIRFVTNDFMFTGGDGYTAFAQGTNVTAARRPLLDVAIEYISAHSPVAPAVEGRWIKH